MLLENLIIKLLKIKIALAQFPPTLPVKPNLIPSLPAESVEPTMPSPSDLPGANPYDSYGGGGGIELVNPLGTYSLQALIDRVISYLLILATPIVAIMVIWGGFLLVTSGGNKDKIQQGWRTIIYAAIGYGVLLIAGGVSFIVQELLHGW